MIEKLLLALSNAGITATVINGELSLGNDMFLKVYDSNREAIISWTHEDFEFEATCMVKDKYNLDSIEYAKGLVELEYDFSKIPLALNEMVRKHDTEQGIGIDDVRFYLEHYCERK